MYLSTIIIPGHVTEGHSIDLVWLVGIGIGIDIIYELSLLI